MSGMSDKSNAWVLLGQLVQDSREARDWREAAQQLLEKARNRDREIEKIKGQISPELGAVLVEHLLRCAMSVPTEGELKIKLFRTDPSDTLIHSLLESMHNRVTSGSESGSKIFSHDFRPFRDDK